jgi:hypothetical protein
VEEALADKSQFIVVATVCGELAANVLKSHLESEGIPVLLEYESAGRVYGLTVDGLAQVRVLVPPALAEKASKIIEPRDLDRTGE